MTTLQDLINDINTKLVRVGSDRISGPDIQTTMLKVADLLGLAQTKDIVPDWDETLTFQTDGSDDGRYCAHPDTNGKSRIWKTKVDNNNGNEPPTEPDITSDANWEERSPSISSGINEWGAGIFGTGLVIVFWNHSVDGDGFYKLVEPTRPFESANIETEITEGKWVRVGGSAVGGLVKPISNTFADITELLADQENQTEGEWYMVTDASTDTTVISGWAIYEKLVATTDSLTDYLKVLEQESLDITINDADETTKGIVELATTAEAITGTDTDRAVTPAGVKAVVDAGTGDTFTGEFSCNKPTGTLYNDLSQSAELTISVGGSAVPGGIGSVRIFPNGDPINIPSNWFGSGDPITTSTDKVNELTVLYVKSSDIRFINRVHDIDTEAPTIIGATFGSDNLYVDLQFSKPVYGDIGGSTPVALADLSFDFVQNGGSATAWTPSSAKKNNNTNEMSAGALAGGESVIRVFGTPTGIPDGLETLEITPVDSTSIYDAFGNACPDTETSGATLLLDDSIIANLTNKVLRLRQTVTIDGSDDVSEWTNIWGASHDAIASSNKPHYNATGGPNNRAYLDFVRASVEKLIGDVLGDTTLTFVMVFKAGNTTNNQFVWIECSSDGLLFSNIGFNIRINGNTIGVQPRNAGGVNEQTFSFTDTSSWHILICRYDSTPGMGNSVLKVSLDGVLKISLTNLNPIVASTYNYRIGATNAAAADIQIAEIFQTSDYKDDSTVADILAELQTFYAL